MKRLAAVLLAVLCLCCQGAQAEEITVTEGQLTYTVKQGKWEKYVNVTGYDLPDGQNYVYIPETWRGMPVYAKGESIPEQVEVVYIPWTRGTIAPPDGRALMNALYVCAEDAGAYKAEFRLSDLQEGDLVLLDVWNCRMENGQWVEQGGYLKREEIPAELDGHRLNTTSSAVVICQTKGECVYYRSPHNGSPTIRDAELPEGAAELVIPRGLEGNAYCYIHSAALGDAIHTIFLPCEYSEVHITDGTRQDSATYCLIEYADYETVMATPELKGKFRDMGEDDYALVEAKLRYVNFATGQEQEQVIAFDEDSLPTQLRGHKLHIFRMLSHKSRVKDDYQKALRGEFDAWMHLIDTAAVDARPAKAEVTFYGIDQGIVEEGTFETDGWTYRAFVDKDGRKTANIVDSSIQTDSDSMVIPSTLDGYGVTGIELESIPASVHTVFMQEDGSGTWIITNSKPSKRKLTAVYYTDWEGAGRPSGMQQDELMFTRVITVDFADGAPRGGQVRKEALPQEINGRRLVFPKSSPDFLFTCGDWGYYLERGEARLAQYLGEEQPEALFVPSEIENYKVLSVEESALSETVKAVYINWEAGVNTAREILTVSYVDYSTYRRIYPDRVIPPGATKEDFIWFSAVRQKLEDNEYVRTDEVIDASLLPAEIDGKRFVAACDSCFTYTSGEWVYYLSPDGYRGRTVATVCGSHFPEGITEMTVPKELDGYPVMTIDATAIPKSVQTINIPKDSYVSMENAKRPNLKIVQIK